MAVHTLFHQQIIPAPLPEVWAFFSNPRNLSRITPPGMGFSTEEKDLPDAIRPGLMITHRLRPLLGIPMTWLTEITHVVEGRRFVDEQRVGPYAVWHHEHDFEDLGDGRTQTTDRVTYVMPFGPLGELAHPWLVAPELKRVFAHREKAMREIFPG
ncbi:SRPBCC family protein [Prosthecobacter vanneervenii]|uniref:Ligand-binding SRPBCC domain-containing protein n=1 Tax=Prosthecobacter vanneervenii TaxID=48466 RepID=A0A7W7YG47_9BACT|nr:SRPBCC family protein [Prosthecobacter vanneervenii]MBB5035382.1 ligand-binding SRPBCC domain-containing protein [Prosthecobacter vanneervenii]